MHYTETTNGRLDLVKVHLGTLIQWAEADAQHALEHDAPGVAKDDRRRAKDLRKALALIEGCKR